MILEQWGAQQGLVDGGTLFSVLNIMSVDYERNTLQLAIPEGGPQRIQYVRVCWPDHEEESPRADESRERSWWQT